MKCAQLMNIHIYLYDNPKNSKGETLEVFLPFVSGSQVQGPMQLQTLGRRNVCFSSWV